MSNNQPNKATDFLCTPFHVDHANGNCADPHCIISMNKLSADDLARQNKATPQATPQSVKPDHRVVFVPGI